MNTAKRHPAGWRRRSACWSAVAIGVGVVAWLRIDPSGEQGSGLPEAFDYDLEKYAEDRSRA